MSRICDPAGHKYIPVEVKELDIYTGIYEILSAIRPDWPQANIKFKVFTDGITNKLVACQLDSANNSENNTNIVLVRIYGNKTDLLIDRDAEVRNITVLNKAGLAPKIYGVFKNGLSYEYYPGVTLNTDTVTDAKISRLVAQQMARMHKIQLGDEIPKEPMVWDKIEQFLSLIPEKFTDACKHASRYPSKDFQINWIRIYLAEYLDNPSPSQTQIEDIYKDVQRLSLASNFKWGIWSLVQFELSDIDFDFGRYAEMRLNRYFEEKNAIYKELL
ncbi:jg8156 [Pararge aegeria aegeria]|uniref:ethanolamine kinase n=1 Tax=Pararge aegeria aegeria TaxID=348720 RepID=A0A8S4SL89_9NEOP|nr:jg8156 [Pararge aegeria aegeria]